MKIKIGNTGCETKEMLRNMGKKNFLKENCGCDGTPAPEDLGPVSDIAGMDPQEAYNLGYDDAVQEIAGMVQEMVHGGVPAEMFGPVKIAVADQLEEKWKDGGEIEQTGEWAGKTVEQLRKRKKQLMDKEKRSKAEQDEVREINFAIRAETGWKKGEGATK